MPHFELTDRPIATPTSCAVCEAHPTPDNPFIDTFIDLLGLRTGSLAVPGRLYLCRLCVRSAALLVGMLAPEDKERLEHEAQAARAEAEQARAEAAEAGDVKTVRMSDLRTVLREGMEEVRGLVGVGVRSEAEPEAEPEQTRRGRRK